MTPNRPLEENSEEVSGEKTLIKGLGFCANGAGSNAAEIDVKDGKIIRIRPLHYDRKYEPEEFGLWKIQARNKVFEPFMKTLIPPLSLSYKKRVHSPNRLLYPLKRVDFDNKGDRHTQNRGQSGFVRISWDEALEIVSSEIKRLHQRYGPYSIFLQADGHGETKVVHGTHGCSTRLLSLLGGYTVQSRNADSWEGWYWGAKHVWGMEPLGQPPQSNTVLDISENTDVVLYWGCDAETTPWGWGGMIATRLMYWFAELGIKSVYICPDLNYAAAVHADKWIPILPNTDAALQLAIAYVWIAAGTYDQDYVATHAVGFAQFEKYVLGQEDGVPKTPQWAAELTGVPSRIIKALAREWASRVTTVAHGNGGSYIRGPYATEPARLEAILLSMQGLGKPGRHYFNLISWQIFGQAKRMPMPMPSVIINLRSAYRGTLNYQSKQFIPKTLVHDAILNPPLSWYGTTAMEAPVEDQFKKYHYPVEGCPEIHMVWTDSPCSLACWNGGNRFIEALKSPKIEFVLAQHPWLENDCLFADVILPANTKFEVEDIGSDNMCGQFDTVFYEGKCIEPLGESKSDYEIVCLIAEKLGVLKEFTQGKSIEEWIKHGFEHSGVANRISYSDFREKEYYVVPVEPDWASRKRGMIDFYQDPEKNPLTTPSGKLEFYSRRLAEHFPDDEERPPHPKWVPYGLTHQESRLHPRAKQYPLLLVSNHPRWREHVNHDDVTWLREIPTCKIKGPDGYYYEPVWINPADAMTRGIRNGDVIKLYNDRGIVLGAALVTERIIAGAVSQDHGARYDPIISGRFDRGGSNNTICPEKTTGCNMAGMATSGFLVEIEKVDLEALQKEYPAAFKRPYQGSSGLRVESFLCE